MKQETVMHGRLKLSSPTILSSSTITILKVTTLVLYQVKLFVPLVMNRNEKNLSLSQGELFNCIMDHVNLYLCNDLIVRVRRNSLRKYIGRETKCMKGMPKYIEELRSTGQKEDLVTFSKPEMI